MRKTAKIEDFCRFRNPARISKRGQITVFIALGITILLLIGFLIYLKYMNYKITEPQEIEFDIQSINLFVENCLKSVGYDALYILGRRGGSIVYEGNGLVTSYSIIDFLYDKGQNKVPSIDKMQEQLSFYVEEMLHSCLDNFTVFKGYDFSYGEIDASTIIGKEDVSFKVHYPITIQRKESTKVTSDFSAVLPIRLNHIREIVNSIVESQINDPGWVDITLMSNFDVNVSIYPYNRTILVYEILDNESLVYNEPYQFLFANRFENE